MMNYLSQILNEISNVLWGFPMIILLIGTHLFLSIRLRFPQRKILTAIRLSLTKDDRTSSGDVSQFGALATALAATIGTGNIIGVGTAIALGGPGAVLWCWLTGIFGIATKYGEGLLAVKYRQMSKRGHMTGGPMYALEYGLHARWAGILFAIFTAIAAFGIGSTVQSNAISTLAVEELHISPWIVSFIVTLLAALVLVGGIRSISKVCTALVPLMAAIYIIGCLVILLINHSYIWATIQLIITSAFAPSAVGGGMIGGGVIMAARYGISRGLFSNESGMGSAPIVAAAAKTRNPVRQALVSASGTFWDTVVICAITGLVIVSSVLSMTDASQLEYATLLEQFQQNIHNNSLGEQLDGGHLTHFAFTKIPVVGTPLLMFGLFTFAFSTILGWVIYAQRSVEYLCKDWDKGVKIYTYLFLSAVFVGGIVELDLVWTFADIFNGLMAIPNLFALILLSKIIVKDTDKYLWSNQLDDNE